MSAKRLYERAEDGDGGAPKPIWHVGDGSALFIGPLHYNAAHAHSVPVYVAGLYGRFGLRIAGRRWQSCRAAVIPAGTSYELDVGGNPLAVLYVEPSVAGVDALRPLVRNGLRVGAALVGTDGELELLRQIYEDRASVDWVRPAADDLISFASRRMMRELDPRISYIVRTMQQHSQELTPAALAAASVGLSSSRFQHLFAEEVGVPYRRYRGWHRLRAAIREVTVGSNLTAAAHAAGFSDQAHFAHSFRRTFGAPASPSLLTLRR